MGNIDKEKLMEKISLARCADEIRFVIKNLPEEPQQSTIDFNALYEEWSILPRDWNESKGPHDQARSFCNFLKSKNLSLPVSFELPIKRTWTLNESYADFINDYGIYNIPVYCLETPPAHPKYYDLHEDVDYSKIPIGSAVHVKYKSGGEQAGFVKKISEKFIGIGFSNNNNNTCSYEINNIESLTILKLPKKE